MGSRLLLLAGIARAALIPLDAPFPRDPADAARTAQRRGRRIGAEGNPGTVFKIVAFVRSATLPAVNLCIPRTPGRDWARFASVAYA